MREDVYRVAADAPAPSEPEVVLGDDYVITVLLLALGVLFSAIGFSEGPGHSTEAGLGVLALIFSIRCFRDAHRARRCRRNGGA